MPQEFFQQLSVLKRKAGFHAAMSWLLVALPCVALALLRISLPTSIFIFVLFLILLIFFCLSNRKKNTQKGSPWVIPALNPDSVLSNFAKVSPDLFYQQVHLQNIKIRLLIQTEDFFSPDTAAQRRRTANQMINQQFGIRQKVSMQESSRLLRINLVVCQENNPELITWIQRSNQTIHRSESILNAAFIRDSSELRIPSLSGIFLFSELKRYTVGIRYLCSLLQAEDISTPLVE